METGDTISLAAKSVDPVRGIAIRRAGGQWVDLRSVKSTEDGLCTDFRLDSLAPLELEARSYDLDLRITDRAGLPREVPGRCLCWSRVYNLSSLERSRYRPVNKTPQPALLQVFLFENSRCHPGLRPSSASDRA